MKYIITHKFCDDGSMSAAVAKRHLPDAVVLPALYDDKWKENEFNSGDFILFTDFCPKPEDLWDLFERGIDFVVMDHHISSVNNLAKYQEEFPDRYAKISPRCFINQSGRCGATLTWWYFNADGVDRPKVLDYIEIADTWTWDRDENAKYVTQYIRTINESGSWEDMQKLLDKFNLEDAIKMGKILYKRLERDIEGLVKKRHYLYINGQKYLAVNSGHDLSMSELGHALSEIDDNGIGIVYSIAYGDVKFSIRGKKATSNARELAEKLGGGGHNEAAGARLEIDQFINFFKNQINEDKNNSHTS